MSKKITKAVKAEETVAQTAQLVRQLYAAGQPLQALSVAENALRSAGKGQAAYAELNNLAGSCALRLKNLVGAEFHFRQAMSRDPGHVKAPGNLSAVLIQTGRFADAEKALARAIELRPDNPAFYGERSGLLLRLARYAEAEAVCRQWLVRSPSDAAAHNMLGQALAGQGKSGEAEAAFRQALLLRPAFAEAMFNLGTLLAEQKDPEGAETAFRAVVAMAPNHVGAISSLGNLCQDQLRDDEAEEHYRRLTVLAPGSVLAWNNLGNLLAKQGLEKEAEAEAALRRGFDLLGGQADTWNDLTRFLVHRNRTADALTVLQQLQRLRPHDLRLKSVLTIMKREIADWSNVDEMEQELLRVIDAGTTEQLEPFTLLNVAGATPAHQRWVGMRNAEAFARADFLRPALSQQKPEPRSCLRIGYLSADFHDHATYFLLIGVLEQHDPARVDVYLYSYGHDSSSPERRRLLDCHVEFRDIKALDDEVAAREIHKDEIDILVDLKGYTRGHRPRITALRPAPLIINWLGYPGTFGHPRMADYLIGDAVVSPPEHAAHFSETLALMPHSYQPNDKLREIGATPTRAEAGLPETGFVFCCFNQAYKIRPEVFALWCRLLLAVPGSVLWLLQPRHDTAAQNLLAMAAAQGLAPERIVWAPSLPQTEHLGRIALADLALDTWPVCSHTTASDALWAGVPLLTRPGETFVSRVAASLLCAAGLPELVLDSDEAIFDMALALASDRSRMQALRAKLAQQRLSCPLFDTAQFTRDLEALYHQIWAQECAGERRLVQLPAGTVK